MDGLSTCTCGARVFQARTAPLTCRSATRIRARTVVSVWTPSTPFPAIAPTAGPVSHFIVTAGEAMYVEKMAWAGDTERGRKGKKWRG